MARLRIRSWLFYGAAALLFLTFFWRPDAPAVRAGRRRHVSVGVSRTLRAELDAFGGSAGKIPASAPRIAIISYDIAGPLLNGGIGTAYTNLACALGRAGLNVTLALALGPVASPASLKTWDEWVADFKARCSVVLTALPAPTERPHHGLAESERSFTAYNWLRSHENDFDVVHFHEWRGIGYHAQLAKHQGLHFLSTLFVVGTHSPSVWSSQGNMLTPTVVELQIDHMERESVRLADVLISPSRYMLEWMRQKHWTLPERLIVYPNIIDGAEKMDDAAVDRSKPMTEVDEFVFFGRLEPRKGLGLFIDAMLQLKERNNFLPKVTLLGKMSERTGSLVHTALQLFPHWKVLNNYSVDQAGEYLRQPGRVAVMPSLSDNSPYTILECIAKGIPFIASDVGGNGELLRAQDRWPVLFRTDQSSLAGTIALANEKGVVRAGPATSFKEVLETWVGWHANLPRVQAVRKAPSKAMVSIVLAIYSADRLDQVARSISWQKDYAGNVELIAVLVGIASEAEVKQCKDMLGAGSLGISSLQYVAMDDGNIGKAWNIGREKAKGSVLVFMENDAILAPGYLNSVTAIISNSGAAAVTSIIDGFAPAESLVDGKPRHRWIPLGASLTTAPFRNPFGDPPFAISQAALDAVGGKFDEQLAMCSHFELFSRLALTGLPVEISTFPVLRKSELYALRLRKLSWTQVLEEKEAAFRPFLDAVPDGSLTGLLSVRDSEPDRAPVMPEYCLAVVPERLPDIVARQADRSESAVSISTRSFKWRSVKQFSKHQGSLGWWYGYRRQEVGSETDEGFVQLANMRRIATPEGDFRMEYWTEAHRFPKQLAVSASTQHPAVALRLTNQTSKHAFLAVRRWQSSFVGNITIKGSISRGANCGDGVEFRLVVGSTVLARHKMLPTPNPVQIDVDAEAEVQVGTFVEMVVDPLGNDECDLTNGEFTLQGHPDRSVE